MGKDSRKSKIWFFKRSCHKIMDQIWGTDKEGKDLAYAWLNKEFGSRIKSKGFHFSQVNDFALLKEVHQRMCELKLIHESRVVAEEVESEWSSWAENEFGEDRISSRRFKRVSSIFEPDAGSVEC